MKIESFKWFYSITVVNTLRGQLQKSGGGVSKSPKSAEAGPKMLIFILF